MFQRDYILRMIEQITQIIATQIFRLKKEDKQQEILTVIDELYARLSLPQSKLIDLLSLEQLISMLSVNDEPDPLKISVVADLLQEEGEAYLQLQDESRGYSKLVKSLSLRLYLHELNESSEVAEPIEDTLEQLKPYDLSPDVTLSVMRYFGRTQRFDRAEDVVFHALDVGGEVGRLSAQAVLFFSSLLAHDDKLLKEGRLPRSEVEAVLKELHSLQR